MQVAYPMLLASKFNIGAKRCGLKFINHLVSEGMNENAGLFYESKHKNEWIVSGWWQKNLSVYTKDGRKLEEAHSAYLNGQACYYLLKSYQLASRGQWDAGENAWLDVCKSILNKVIDDQRSDGAYPVYFDPSNGDPLYFESFQGAWFLAAISELYKVSRDEKYFDSLKKAFTFYAEFYKRGELWGTPIDTCDALMKKGTLRL